ncbi:MAG: type II toxin-antitoxin system RatA family toxin [Micavibrio aeruginosavorus]|uniref:Type II toxin-antitoxin system RatA family toxin n=1 Tax=Micavibrio aeruginosavorus TaxID=349221 RepID=A0A7T5R0T5_9BACT|nr:MAG: type II toxin-antitoxin system RatA family toxin [Micavibrio aeruginosavorus]
MPTHAERRKMPYTPEQMFDLVASVDKYPEFLPWCLASRITKRDGHVFYADLVIGYKMVREKFGSRVTALRPDHIHVEYLSGPMKHLSNHWRFLPQEDGGCIIDFYVDFEFKNPVLQRLIAVFFEEAVKRMVTAFEARARDLYTMK